MNLARLLMQRLLKCLPVLWLAAAGPVMGQPAGADGDDFLYRVRQGDVLLELAQRYTETPQNWTTLQQINAIADDRALPIGKVLRIPFSLIPEVPAPARVVHASGEVISDAGAVRAGERIPENTRITTGPDGFATLLLDDGSALTVPSNSTLSMRRLQAFKGTGLTDTIVSVDEGSIESIVAPDETGVGRFEIRTPVTITGVRGTRLRVHSGDDGARTELLDGVAHLGASRTGRAILKPGQGAATRPDGVLGSVRPLPPAPRLSTPERGPRGWQVAFPPVPGASAYLVRVADDPEGTRPWSSQVFESPDEVSFRAPGPGTYYVVVRAIDDEGLMGPDDARPFEGQGMLVSSSGMPVASGHGGTIYLTPY